MANGQYLPPLLFKYRPFDKVTIDLLELNRCYFSDPAKDFKDPFDCQLGISFYGRTEEWKVRLEEVARRNNAQFPPETITRFAAELSSPSGPTSPEVQKMVVGLQQAHLSVVDNESKPIGVWCVTAKPADPVMFSHYGDGHQGVCLGFSTDPYVPHWYSDPLRATWRVDYPEKIDERHFLDLKDLDDLKWRLSTKLPQWRYEAEWRVVDLKDGAGLKSFPPELLEVVILGARIKTTDRDLVLQLVSRRKPKPWVFQSILLATEIGLGLVVRGDTPSKRWEAMISPTKKAKT